MTPRKIYEEDEMEIQIAPIRGKWEVYGDTEASGFSEPPWRRNRDRKKSIIRKCKSHALLA